MLFSGITLIPGRKSKKSILSRYAMAESQQNPFTRNYPFFIKAPVILLGLILFFFILHVLAEVLVPFAFAFLIAILLNPLSRRLGRKLPRGIAIFFAILIALTFVVTVCYFLSRQMLTFNESLPALKAKSSMIAEQVQLWIKNNFGLSVQKQLEMVDGAVKGGEAYVGTTVSALLGGVVVLIIIPIYVFFLLFYKHLLLDFIFIVFTEKNSLRVAEILSETKIAIQKYVVGLLIEMVIVSAMNSTALLILGVKSAILIGVIGGILNVIPYLGGIVAIALPILMATVTKEGYSTQIEILISYMIIQLIDNNILVPNIVSSKMQINALFSILIVLCGGMLWGYSGMFLSIPFVAILKIIFDRIDGLKPWGHVLGTKVPEKHIGIKWQAKWARRFKNSDEGKETKML